MGGVVGLRSGDPAVNVVSEGRRTSEASVNFARPTIAASLLGEVI